MLLKTWLNGFRNYFIRPRRLAVLAACITLLVGLPIWYFAQHFYAQYLISEQRRVLQTDLSVSSGALEAELKSTPWHGRNFKVFYPG